MAVCYGDWSDGVAVWDEGPGYELKRGEPVMSEALAASCGV